MFAITDATDVLGSIIQTIVVDMVVVPVLDMLSANIREALPYHRMNSYHYTIIAYIIIVFVFMQLCGLSVDSNIS